MNTTSRVAVDKHMTQYPLVAATDMSLSRALRLMKEFRIRHLPVIDKNKIVGVVSERDLTRMEPYVDSMSIMLGDIMIRDPYVAKIGTPLEEVTDIMAAHKFGCAVVVSPREEVIGIFTTIDALKILTTILKEERNEAQYERTLEDYFEWDASIGE